jgi:hypothetical protein
MGLHVEFEEPTTAALPLPSGDRVQIFGPGGTSTFPALLGTSTGMILLSKEISGGEPPLLPLVNVTVHGNAVRPRGSS